MSRLRIIRATFFVSAVTASVALLVLFAELGSTQDVVEVRNAFLIKVAPADAFSWSPTSVPKDYLMEKQPIHSDLSLIVDQLFDHLENLSGDFSRALVIARHLVENSRRPAVPVKSTTRRTYTAIRENGYGYCADYTQVFIALAYSANIMAREWGMSFDGYSGDGHAFNEVYDSELGKWVFLDPFYSFYIEGSDGIPLSFLEFRAALITGQQGHINVRPIDAEKFSFSDEEQVFSYYMRGMASVFMIWGNNVLSYDRHPAVKLGRPFGRAAEQIAAIVAGVQPSLMVTPDTANQKGLAKLQRYRWAVFVASCAFLIFVVLGLFLLRMRKCSERVEWK